MKRTIFLALGAGVITGFLLLVIVFQLMSVVISDKVVMESYQGDYIKYGSYDPYCLSIIKQSQPLSSNYIIMISRKDDKNYGHVLNYIDPLQTSEAEIQKTLVYLVTTMGHRDNIPHGIIKRTRVISASASQTPVWDGRSLNLCNNEIVNWRDIYRTVAESLAF